MLENLRRKSLTKTYNDRQVHFESGLAKYENYAEIDVCTQKLSKKKLAESTFKKAIDTISSDISLWFRFNMIYCPKGSFTMGHKDESDNKPRTEIIDTPFLLGETEITQELYEKVMKENPSEFKNNPQNPVEQVSWYDAILFCNELSKLQGLDKCYALKNISTKNREGVDQNRIMSAQVTYDSKKNGYRLPEEKEWEYAAKAGTENKWAGTDDGNRLGEYAWINKNSRVDVRQQAHMVKTRKPNEWGFYDMSGNVHEWCWDEYVGNGENSDCRFLRGGNFLMDASYSHSAHRFRLWPEERTYFVGFRVCRSIVN